MEKPKPYIEDKPKPLKDFLHGEELLEKQEEARERRHKELLRYLDIDQKEKRAWD